MDSAPISDQDLVLAELMSLDKINLSDENPLQIDIDKTKIAVLPSGIRIQSAESTKNPLETAFKTETATPAPIVITSPGPSMASVSSTQNHQHEDSERKTVSPKEGSKHSSTSASMKPQLVSPQKSPANFFARQDSYTKGSATFSTRKDHDDHDDRELRQSTTSIDRKSSQERSKTSKDKLQSPENRGFKR